MDRVKIKILESNHYVIRRLQNKNINIYDIKYNKSGNEYTINLKDLDQIPFDYELISYNGLMGFYIKIKRNIHFLISIFLSIILIFIFSFVIIRVDVIHSDKAIRELVLDELDNYGIHPLMFKKDFFDIKKIKETILDKHKDSLEWIEIINEGMRYIVRVEERIITKDIEEDKYCDVVSKKDAVILTSRTLKGEQTSFANDFVKKGSTLISGTIKLNDSVKSYTCASGEVYGNTWYTVTITLPYDYIYKDYTSKKSYNLSFEYGSKRVPLLKVHFDNYDVIREPIISLGKLTIYKEKNLEYNNINSQYTDDEIRDIALSNAREKLLLNLENNSSILSEKVLQYNRYNSIIEMEIFYSVKEIISRVEEKEIPEEGRDSNENT